MDNFVCVRHQKIKNSTQLKYAEMEHNRDGRFATRDNIIQSKTKNNIYFSNIKNDDMNTMFERMKNIYETKKNRKLRKDCVKCIDTVFCVSKCSQEDMDKLLKASILTYKKLLGKSICPLKIWGHCDELGECHIHGMAIPIDTNGNCLTDLFMKKEQLQKVQDIFNECCIYYGIDTKRGISKKDRFDKGLDQNYHINNYKFLKSSEGEKWLKDKTQIVRDLEEKQAELLKRNEELEDKNKAFGSAFENGSLDDIISLGRF